MVSGDDFVDFIANLEQIYWLIGVTEEKKFQQETNNAIQGSQHPLHGVGTEGTQDHLLILAIKTASSADFITTKNIGRLP